MALVIQYARMEQWTRTPAEWASDDPVLRPGELGIADDGGGTVEIRIGDGVSRWSALATSHVLVDRATADGTYAAQVSPTLTSPQPTAPLSAELATDPGFDNPAAWTTSGLASISGSAAVFTGAGSVAQSIAVTAGERYQIVVTTSQATAGNLTVTLGAVSASRESWNDKAFLLSPSTTETATLTLAVDAGSWTMTAVTVKRITGDSTPSATVGAAQVRASGANTAAGFNAQRSLTTGGNNTAAGSYAQYSPLGTAINATTTASYQTSVGTESGQSSATQVDGITTIGYRAAAGAANATALGRESSADHAGSVALGYQTTTTAVGQVMCGPRDVEITDATKGVVLKSPGGTRYRLTVSDAGAVTVAAA